ncbi:Putative elongation factor TypA-like SVR3, partial [Durusdinium trenchii]
MRRDDLRNIAIIAHVDHGKTTLVDGLLRQSGQFRDSELAEECILDSNDLERERGITILSKNIALEYRGVKINIIDTPGHADFGGEDAFNLASEVGVARRVDAFEGPRPQTRFVLTKALELGLRPLIVINKIDRPDCRPDDVLLETVHLMEELGAEDSLDIPYIYASGRSGFASHDADARSGTMMPLLDLVLEHIPGPEVKQDSALQMMVTSLVWSEYVGRIAVGKIISGSVKQSQRVAIMQANDQIQNATIEGVEVFDKLGRTKVDSADAGDIVALTGLADVEIGDTVADIEQPVALPRIKVDEPTLSMVFTINSSPLAGKSGKFLTSRHLRNRLDRELQSNVALKVDQTDLKDIFKVSGRGLLHLSILIETMRREGFEISVGTPEVIRKRVDGKWHEPFEVLEVDVPATDVGTVIEIVSGRKGQMLEMVPGTGSHTHIEFSIPVTGKTSAYALAKLQERAELFVGSGADCYEGMIVGENSRDNDLVVNPIREKKLTNIRASGFDSTFMEKDDFVASPDRRQATRQVDDCSPLGKTLVRIVDERFRVVIERDTRLFDDDDGWIAKGRSSEAEAKRIACRQFLSLQAKHCFVALRQPCDKTVGMCQFGGFGGMLQREPGIAA